MDSEGETSGERSGPAPAPGPAKYKGVRLRKWGKWVAEVRYPKSRKRLWLGSFASQEMAARAYDAAMLYLRGPGEQHYFNFPDQLPDIAAAEGLSRFEIKDKAVRYAREGAGESQEPAPEMGCSDGGGGDEEAAEKDVGGGEAGSGIDEVLPPELIYGDPPALLDDVDWSVVDQGSWRDGGDDDDSDIFGSIQLWNFDD